MIGGHSLRYYKRFIKDTNCNSFYIDEDTPSIKIFADDPSNVEKGTWSIINTLKSKARFGRNRLRDFTFQRDKIVEVKYSHRKNDVTSLDQKEETNSNGYYRSSRDERKVAHRNERVSFTSRLILPMRRTTAWGKFKLTIILLCKVGGFLSQNLRTLQCGNRPFDWKRGSNH